MAKRTTPLSSEQMYIYASDLFERLKALDSSHNEYEDVKLYKVKGKPLVKSNDIPEWVIGTQAIILLENYVWDLSDY